MLVKRVFYSNFLHIIHNLAQRYYNFFTYANFYDFFHKKMILTWAIYGAPKSKMFNISAPRCLIGIMSVSLPMQKALKSMKF